MSIFPGASIHSFEPAAQTFSTLQKNLASSLGNYQGQVKLNNLGLSDKTTDATLHYDRLNSGIASLYDRQLDHLGVDYSMSETVKLSTLDEYCKRNGISSIDWLKMDVEGNELNVLKGAEEMLSRHGIRALQMEFGGCNIDSRTYFRDFWNLLHNDFRVFYVGVDALIEITGYSETLEIFTTTNFIFYRK